MDARLEDEDIDRLLELEGNPRRAAAFAADVLSAKFARKAEAGGPQRVAGPSGRAAELRALANRLRAGAALEAAPFAGGQSKAAKEAAASNPDRVQPAFARGLMDHPDAPTS